MYKLLDLLDTIAGKLIAAIIVITIFVAIDQYTRSMTHVTAKCYNVEQDKVIVYSATSRYIDVTDEEVSIKTTAKTLKYERRHCDILTERSY